MSHRARRRLINRAMLTLATLCAIAAMVPVLSVLIHVFRAGSGAISLDFFTKTPAPVGEPGGGMANALIGSVIIVTGASLVGLPVGILGGIYLSEFGENRFAAWVRFAADVVNGVPSIVAGLFVWPLIVVPMGRFSALAGSAALTVIMIPLVMRTTEEMLRLVPRSQRDGALAVGATRARTTLCVVLPAAMSGVVTGCLLAIARIFGETAPLLFTSFGNYWWSLKLDQPMASLPVQIYNYAVSPYDDWHELAWAGALVLVSLTLTLNVLARLATRGKFKLT